MRCSRYPDDVAARLVERWEAQRRRGGLRNPPMQDARASRDGLSVLAAARGRTPRKGSKVPRKHAAPRKSWFTRLAIIIMPISGRPEIGALHFFSRRKGKRERVVRAQGEADAGPRANKYWLRGFVPRTKSAFARLILMPGKTPPPMGMQPLDDGRDMPRQMTSRVRVIGPKKPLRNDKVHCAKKRNGALTKQRAALRAAVPGKPL